MALTHDTTLPQPLIDHPEHFAIYAVRGPNEPVLFIDRLAGHALPAAEALELGAFLARKDVRRVLYGQPRYYSCPPAWFEVNDDIGLAICTGFHGELTQPEARLLGEFLARPDVIEHLRQLAQAA